MTQNLDPADTLHALRQKLARQETEIAQLRARLAAAERHAPWVSEACGDDLWDNSHFETAAGLPAR